MARKTTAGEPTLFFPALAEFYASVSDLWYPMIRIMAGAFLFTHGWMKLHSGVAGVAGFMAKSGFAPPTAFAYAAIFLETVGAVCIAAGLFTRFFAAALAIEFACIAWLYSAQGFGKMEPVLIWGILFFAIALRGGGPYSLDRVIGKEL
ncbi:MAG TPA: DoxX family protein [Pseudolabrys sp.]|nr:DoxX family protein [Pseudolabrys sp.]